MVQETVIQLDGVLDGAAALRIGRCIDELRARRVVLDLRDMRDVQHSGLATLADEISRIGATVELRGLNDQQVRVLRYLGVEVDGLGRFLGMTPRAEA